MSRTKERKETILCVPQADLAEIRALLCQEQEHISLDGLINPYNGDRLWKERLNDPDKGWWWAVGYRGTVLKRNRYLLPLRDRLLAIGGCEACFAFEEPDFLNIMKYGQLWDNVSVRQKRGRVSQCHANACTLWKAGRSACFLEKGAYAPIICTGYALSEDGFWRQHSWLMEFRPRKNILIETTEPRIAYYGYGMTYRLAEQFCMDNP